MNVLDSEKIEYKNRRFGEDEVKSLCDTLRLNTKELILRALNFKASGGRSIPDQVNKLLAAVDIISPSNNDCEQGFSAMNNIITVIRNVITTSNAEKKLFISTVGPPCKKWDSD